MKRQTTPPLSLERIGAFYQTLIDFSSYRETPEELLDSYSEELTGCFEELLTGENLDESRELMEKLEELIEHCTDLLRTEANKRLKEYNKNIKSSGRPGQLGLQG